MYLTLIYLPVGLLLPTLIGWLTLRLLERDHPVLFRFERWVLGFVIGLTGTMFVQFVLHLGLGVSFSLLAFIAVQAALLAILFIWSLGIPKASSPVPPLAPGSRSRWGTLTLVVLGVWTAIKIVALSADLIATPTVLDDTIDNWNIRGKVFYEHQELRLILPFETQIGGISSYPPTIPMAKALLAAYAREWTEPLVNSIHILWYIAVLLLFYWSLRRELSREWALVGTYALSSIPLFTLHGMNPYAEMFMVAHIFPAVSFLYHGLKNSDPLERRTYLQISAAVTSLLPFTKNEGLIMHLPILLLILTGGLVWLWWKKRITNRDIVVIALSYTLPLLVVAIPWIAFKWMQGLPFGNAKSVSGLTLAWQPGVVIAVIVMTFAEGNWLLLFPFFLALLAYQWRRALTSSLLILVLYVFIVYGGQLFLFLFTALSIEARMQTGYGRGLVQLTPIVVFIMTILLCQSINTIKRITNQE